jgi:Bacterial regulatory proteins, lacI family
VAGRDLVVKRRHAVTTINEVARHAGVSESLVSFVVNKRPGAAAATRAPILRVAEKLNWRPSIKARTLSTRTTYTLGLGIRRSSEIVVAYPFFPAFMTGVEWVLAQQARPPRCSSSSASRPCWSAASTRPSRCRGLAPTTRLGSPVQSRA